MLNDHARQTLRALLGKNQVFTDTASLLAYEVDAGLDRGLPEGVVLPQSVEDVAVVARWAAEHGVPLIGRGAGTGLSGGAVAEHGGLILEFSRMNRVLEIDTHGRTALVEPGLINLRLDEQAGELGLYFPPDPASQRASTVGGNVSENSGGPHCFKYGVTTNYIMGMQVVLAGGRVMRVGGSAYDYPAYDFCGVLVGSEGTLALMTAITARLVRTPPAVQTLLAVFDSVEQAGGAVSAVIAAGLVPATMEMMDQKIIRIVEEYVHAGLPLDAEAILIIDVDGYPASLDAQREEIAGILQAHGGYGLRTAKSAEERNQIWFARKSAAGALARLAPAQYTIDITVPRSRLAEALVEVNAICERYRLRVGYVFHAGDGNLHPLILIPDPADRELMRRVHEAGRETVEVAVRKNGSLSGEHGIGIEKRAFMPLMFNEAELSAMLDIKQVFDPRNLLNPGKIFPASSPVHHGDNLGVIPNENTDGDAAPVVGTRFIASSPQHDTPMILSPSSSPSLSMEDAMHHAPANVEDAARLLAQCTRAGRRVYITGKTSEEPARTAERRECITLNTSSLRGIINYVPEDMYITVGAGTPLAEVQAFLAEHGQQVPLASPWPGATIGGLVAANMNAPLRMRYGAIRDLLLCATVALADGRVIRAGRPVIKNVAGFDLVKLFIGSHGTLGLLSDLTLKFTAQPRARRSLIIPVDDLRYGLLCARELYPLSLAASAILLVTRESLLRFMNNNQGKHDKGIKDMQDALAACPYVLLYTAEGLAEDVQAELQQVHETLRSQKIRNVVAPLAGAIGKEPLVGAIGREPVARAIGKEPVEIGGISGTDLWADFLGQAANSIQVRVAVPVRDLPSYVQDQSSLLAVAPFLVDFAGGFVYCLLPAQEYDLVTKMVEQLRAPALQAGGYAAVTHIPEGWPESLDRWGYRPETLDLMRELKARWDPAGILNPGGFVI